MTIDEMKQTLSERALPEQFKLSEWEYINDVPHFVKTQLHICYLTGEKYANTPAWERITRFEEATRPVPQEQISEQ